MPPCPIFGPLGRGFFSREDGVLQSANRLDFDLSFSAVRPDGIFFSPGRIRLFVSVMMAKGIFLVYGRDLMKDEL